MWLTTGARRLRDVVGCTAVRSMTRRRWLYGWLVTTHLAKHSRPVTFLSCAYLATIPDRSWSSFHWFQRDCSKTSVRRTVCGLCHFLRVVVRRWCGPDQLNAFRPKYKYPTKQRTEKRFLRSAFHHGTSSNYFSNQTTETSSLQHFDSKLSASTKTLTLTSTHQLLKSAASFRMPAPVLYILSCTCRVPWTIPWCVKSKKKCRFLKENSN